MTDKNADRFRNYINQGELEKHNLNSHSQRREPWYSVKTGNVPDAFFPYRVSLIPYLMLNRGNIQCTNSIHRIYFKNATNIEKKWIQVSLLSIPGQLSLEAHAKVYGCGILKIEPSSLKKALCFSSKDRSIVSVYNKLSNLLQENKKREAMKAATEFINDYLGIDAALSLQAQTAYEELLANRQRRKLKQ
jgi:hypothetical protein